MQGIYKIVNKIDGKFYVGSSSNLERREADHFGKLKNGNHRNSYLQAAYDKYGKNNFEFIVVEKTLDLTKEELLSKEQVYLDTLSRETSYNLTYLANGGGADVMEIPTYVLDLDCNILYEASSIQKATQYVTGKNVQYGSHNKGRRFYSDYMIATKEFYTNHPEEVDKWKLKYINKRKSKISKLYNKLKKLEDRIVLIDYEGETKEFENMSAVARFLGISRQLVENRLKRKAKKNIYNIRYKYNQTVFPEVRPPSKRKIPIVPIILREGNKETEFNFLTEVAAYLKVTPETVARAIRKGNKKNKYEIWYKTII